MEEKITIFFFGYKRGPQARENNDLINIFLIIGVF